MWLPWTEDPEDSEATRIREAQSSAARHLYLGLERLLGADDRALGFALNSLTNEKAMRTLPAGFAGTPRRRFLPLLARGQAAPRVPSAQPARTSSGLARAQVIRDMNPPAGESYFRLLRAAEEHASVRLPPLPEDGSSRPRSSRPKRSWRT